MRPRVRILSVPRKAKTVRSAGDPPRGSSATSGDGASSELVRLVLLHFGAEFEAALRAAYEEVIGTPLPPRFTIELQSRSPASRRELPAPDLHERPRATLYTPQQEPGETGPRRGVGQEAASSPYRLRR